MRRSIEFVVVMIIGLLMLFSVIGGYVTAKEPSDELAGIDPINPILS